MLRSSVSGTCTYAWSPNRISPQPIADAMPDEFARDVLDRREATLPLRPPLRMSGVCIEPDRSTASMMLRLVDGQVHSFADHLGARGRQHQHEPRQRPQCHSRARERRRAVVRQRRAQRTKKGKRSSGGGRCAAAGSIMANSGSGNRRQHPWPRRIRCSCRAPGILRDPLANQRGQARVSTSAE